MTKVHVTKAVSAQIKTEVADAAKAVGKSESAYLAGLIRYTDDYLAYRRQREQQIEEYGALCTEWIRDLLQLKDAGDDGTQQEYESLKNRLFLLQKVEKELCREGNDK